MKHWIPRLEDARALPLQDLGPPQWESGWEPYRRLRLPRQEIAQGFAALLFFAVAWVSITSDPPAEALKAIHVYESFVTMA